MLGACHCKQHKPFSLGAYLGIPALPLPVCRLASGEVGSSLRMRLLQGRHGWLTLKRTKKREGSCAKLMLRETI